MDSQIPHCDWCQQPLTGEGVIVNGRFRFHDDNEHPCFDTYKRHTLHMKLEHTRPRLEQNGG